MYSYESELRHLKKQGFKYAIRFSLIGGSTGFMKIGDFWELWKSDDRFKEIKKTYERLVSSECNIFIGDYYGPEREKMAIYAVQVGAPGEAIRPLQIIGFLWDLENSFNDVAVGDSE